jgi:3-phosphoshikimate 1-carboxyvinyltransferase
MRLSVTPGSSVSGDVRVPGDKSISHRWLILASTAMGPSRLVGLPASLDVRSTAGCMAVLAPPARPALDAWASNAAVFVEDGGSTWNSGPSRRPQPALEVEGEGRDALVEPPGPLECGNSGTTMRLLMGLLSSSPFASALTGDSSLALRPMERVAEPLRRMGADVRTSGGGPPVSVRGSRLRGIDFTSPVPSAQVKSAILLAGVAASGVTTVRESLPTRDHTERALQALGVPIDLRSGTASVRRFQHEGFAGSVPGDPSTAAFLVAAAALTGSPLEIYGLSLNPTRLHFLEVLGRMGVRTESRIDDHELGEPVGDLFVAPCGGIVPVRVEPQELPLVVDEVPVLAAVAAHALGDSWFLGAEELRLKESDRLGAIAAGIRGLGGHAADEGMDLVVAGGGLEGGRADARGDHRMALSLAVAALAARAPCEIDGFESADVSFPGAARIIRELGGRVEVIG